MEIAIYFNQEVNHTYSFCQALNISSLNVELLVRLHFPHLINNFLEKDFVLEVIAVILMLFVHVSKSKAVFVY